MARARSAATMSRDAAGAEAGAGGDGAVRVACVDGFDEGGAVGGLGAVAVAALCARRRGR